MKLTLARLALENFKGQSTNFQFADQTYIYGANGSGKTTQYDAFLWLLFGKDSLGRTDYKIKPLLPDWTEQHRVTVSVQGVFDRNGQQLVLKRIYSEKWTKKKGAEEAEYDGDKTDYEYNGVPCNQTEYKARISAFIDETLFRLITSASYFNSMKWQDRRVMLLQAAGEPTNEEVAGSDNSFLALLNQCSGKLLDDYRKEVSAAKKPIKKELDGIPFAIEEVRKQIFDKDWITLEATLAEKTAEINTLQDGVDNENQRVQDANKETNSRVQALYNDITSLERKKMEIENRYKTEYNNTVSGISLKKNQLQSEIRSAQDKLARNERNEKDFNQRLTYTTELRDKIGVQYLAVKAGKIEDKDKICPACMRAFEGHDLENLINNLLGSISKEGFSKKEQIESLTEELSKIKKTKKDILEKIKNAESELDALNATQVKHFVSATNEDAEYKEVASSIADKKETIDIIADSAEKSGDLSAVKDKIASLKREVQGIQQELYGKKIVENSRTRLAELEKKEKDLSVELASLEKIEMCADRFIKRKLDMMEEKVNSMFSLVKWRMYEPQVNGGEKEICECGIDGKTYGSLNTAAKINAGLDIANTFSRINNVYAPIWIDNRESVTDIIPVESQTISLIVSPEHKLLTIKN